MRSARGRRFSLRRRGAETVAVHDHPPAAAAAASCDCFRDGRAAEHDRPVRPRAMRRRRARSARRPARASPVERVQLAAGGRRPDRADDGSRGAARPRPAKATTALRAARIRWIGHARKPGTLRCKSWMSTLGQWGRRQSNRANDACLTGGRNDPGSTTPGRGPHGRRTRRRTRRRSPATNRSRFGPTRPISDRTSGRTDTRAVRDRHRKGPHATASPGGMDAPRIAGRPALKPNRDARPRPARPIARWSPEAGGRI